MKMEQKTNDEFMRNILVEEAWLRHVSLVYDCLTFHSTRWK